MKRYTSENVKDVFNFRVNKEFLYEDDFDLLYTAERLTKNLFVVYFEWLDGKTHSSYYNVQEVLTYLNDGSWLVEGVDFPIEEEPTELTDDEKWFLDYLGF